MMITKKLEGKKQKITSGTKEWADYNVNCIKGCRNNCRYCYAKVMAKRFGRVDGDAWESMRVREEVLTKDFRKRPGRVMFPSTHDIFNISPFKEACFSVLAKLLKSENNLLITTKPRLAVIQEISHQFDNYKGQIEFRFTITSNNDRLLGTKRSQIPRTASFFEVCLQKEIQNKRINRTFPRLRPHRTSRRNNTLHY